MNLCLLWLNEAKGHLNYCNFMEYCTKNVQFFLIVYTEKLELIYPNQNSRLLLSTIQFSLLPLSSQLLASRHTSITCQSIKDASDNIYCAGVKWNSVDKEEEESKSICMTMVWALKNIARWISGLYWYSCVNAVLFPVFSIVWTLSLKQYLHMNSKHKTVDI